MNQKETFEGHALNLGKLVGNLLTLELMALLALVRLKTPHGGPVTTQLPQVK